jgi:hypothetical protein
MLTVRITDEAQRARVRAYARKVEERVTADVLGTIITDRAMGRVSAYDWVQDTRPSGIIALYDAHSATGRAITRKQTLRHDAADCDDDDCAVCDAMYATAPSNAYL